MRPKSFTVSSVAASSAIPLDHRSAAGAGVVLDFTGTATASVEVTMDDIYAIQARDGNLTAVKWVVDSNFSGLSADKTGTLPVGVRAARLNVTAWTSGDVILNISQPVQ